VGEDILSNNDRVNKELNPGERVLYQTGEKFIKSPVEQVSKPVGHSFISLLRFFRRNHPIGPANIPENPNRPTGPYIPAPEGPKCALNIFVPRNFKSRFIDNFTGKYGYSHVAIDCGELDQPTGKRVMIESTLFDVVHRSFEDTYGKRAYVKIPLDQIDMDTDAFCECVKSKLGEKYDYAEALTWDEIDDPARQICSDLAAVCMPDWLVAEFAQARINGVLPRNSISASHHHGGKLDMFISPNALAIFFNAPRGDTLGGPGVLADPQIQTNAKTTHSAFSMFTIPILGLIGFATWYYFGHHKHQTSS
jgi:hypothetical protein